MVLSAKGGDPEIDRITMTFPLLNNAGKIAFLVSGNNKSAILRDVLKERRKGLPAHKINPVHGGLIWFLDREAAALIGENKN